MFGLFSSPCQFSTLPSSFFTSSENLDVRIAEVEIRNDSFDRN